MKLLDLLKGKKINAVTDMKTHALLIVEKAEEIHHSKEIGPSTRENDWWPETKEWTTIRITFTNGAITEYSSLSAIEIVE